VSSSSDGTVQVDRYLAEVGSPQRETLEGLRSTLRRILPHATEAMRYGMPALTLDGNAVAGYAAYKEHCGYFPMSGSVIEAAGSAVSGYTVSKGGLRFPPDRSLPVGLVRRLVRLRLDELAAVEDGKRFEYYDDGQLKAAGRMKGGRLHGRWAWYRKDGTRSRTGQFADGEQVGVWKTWARDGTCVSTTRH
jgi:uncharacterized protein YdhG (YjbR/CyaY superfamily)